MKSAMIVALTLATFAFFSAAQSGSVSTQLTSMSNSICGLPAAKVSASCSIQAAQDVSNWKASPALAGMFRSDEVVYDRCPPDSDKFCPAGTSCCTNSAGEYRCCK